MSDKEREIPIDAKLLSEAVIELNIARRNVSIYPPDHPAIQGSIKRALQKLDELVTQGKVVTVAVSGDALVVDDKKLEEKNPVLKEFASHLHGLGISHVTFKKGITAQELLLFNRKILSRGKRDEPITESEIENLKGELPHVEIGLMDYDLLRVETGEAEEAERGEGLWDRYIYGLLTGTLAPESAKSVVPVIPPTALAKILNESHEKIPGTKKDYEKVIAAYLHQSLGREFASEDVKKLVKLVNALKPELKKQFLTITADRFPRHERELERALSQLSPEEVERFVEFLESQTYQIPEPLKNVISKFSQVDESLSELGFVGTVPFLDDLLLNGEMAVLLEKGKYEEFVTDEYRQEIERIINYKTDAKKTTGTGADLLPTDEEVERDYLEILLELVEYSEIDGAYYENIVSSIASRIMALNEAGDLAGALEGLEFLKKESEEGKFPDLAEKQLEKLLEEESLKSFVNTLRLIGRRERESSSKLAALLGKKFIPHLMDALKDEEESAVRKFLITLLSSLGEDAAEEAVKRLEDERWFVTRNMLHIISLCGTKEHAEKARKFLDHPNPRIRSEAFRCLLKHDDQEAKNKLLSHLKNPRDEFFHQSMDLAGKFKITEAVDPISAFVLKKATTGADFDAKKQAVMALAEIGHPSAIKTYREILKEKSLLYKGALDSLKDLVYMNLKYFPFDEIRDMAEMGLKSKNDMVRRECQKLLKKKGMGK